MFIGNLNLPSSSRQRGFCWTTRVWKVMVENICELFTYATINLYSALAALSPSLPGAWNGRTKQQQFSATIIGLLLLCQWINKLNLGGDESVTWGRRDVGEEEMKSNHRRALPWRDYTTRRPTNVLELFSVPIPDTLLILACHPCQLVCPTWFCFASLRIRNKPQKDYRRYPICVRR